MIWPAVDVAIPANNEERAIGATIASILAQEYPGQLRIYVCANSCTDHTVGVVRRLQATGAPVHLDITRERGKPNAWNRLRAMSSAPLICFADADVLFAPEAIRSMVTTLERRKDLCAVGGKTAPILTDQPRIKRLLAPPAAPVTSLCGRLYLCRADRLAERLQYHGFREMPRELIHDDRWITYVIGKGNWVGSRSAVAYYLPPTLEEWVGLYRRSHRGMAQIKKRWGELHERNRPTRLEMWNARAVGFLRQESAPGYFGSIVGIVLRRGLCRIAGGQVRAEGKLQQARGSEAAMGWDATWERAESTKALATHWSDMPLPEAEPGAPQETLLSV